MAKRGRWRRERRGVVGDRFCRVGVAVGCVDADLKRGDRPLREAVPVTILLLYCKDYLVHDFHNILVLVWGQFYRGFAAERGWSFCVLRLASPAGEGMTWSPLGGRDVRLFFSGGVLGSNDATVGCQSLETLIDRA